jgi:hypothetical protein
MSGNRHCARPGCGGEVAALLSYDYAGQRIWLDDPAAETGGHHSALCAAHASRLRAPKGWSCQDRRTYRPAQALLVPGRFAAPEPAASPPAFLVPERVLPEPAASPTAAEPAPAAGLADQVADGAVPPQRDGGVIAGLTAIAV